MCLKLPSASVFPEAEQGFRSKWLSASVISRNRALIYVLSGAVRRVSEEQSGMCLATRVNFTAEFAVRGNEFNETASFPDTKAIFAVNFAFVASRTEHSSPKQYAHLIRDLPFAALYRVF